ncbi:ribosomal protein L35Ae-domain-containing protein [Aspergillus pseudotamarii]|uniref:Ribosomal protein L35Ae-domain-containing protein n=1 Tax=Aspergillus pseudotamarii TaxID=132259 RepID=A0A5N6SM49_ASPPS|nr:ribosomal protein L35Ae-domain-containing protein [Aspergillus pseudotamarii]KAE8134204.1 ribosomal protein L35Ae-domain-containing protein [Aspergillus pseudotamarii]
MPSEHGHRREYTSGIVECYGFGYGYGYGYGVCDNGFTWIYVKGRHLSYQRSKRQVNPNTSLIKIDGVDNTEAANFYLGKKVAFVYRAKREVRGSNIRVIWGKVTRPHGNSGVVRAQFRHNLPPKSFGATVRVMLYPSNI